MALQNTTPDASKHPGHTSPGTTTGVSLSRRKKIAIVLFLMLSGMFLIDDRPAPPPPGNEVQEFMDALTYQSEDIAQAPASAGSPQPTAEQTLQLPDAHRTQNFPAVAQSEFSSLDNFNSANGTGAERETAMAPPQYRQVAQTTRPTVKFTGQIEPLY